MRFTARSRVDKLAALAKANDRRAAVDAIKNGPNL